MEKKLAYLEMIQGVINRMGNNSFVLKGFAITIFAAIIALKEITLVTGIILIMFSCIFWSLDSYYLRLERMYRKLYDEMRKKDDNFSFDFDMDLKKYESSIPYLRVFFSFSEIVLYLPSNEIVNASLKR